LPVSLWSPFSVLLFHDPSPSAIYSLSLHDALPISDSLVALLPGGTRDRFGNVIVTLGREAQNASPAATSTSRGTSMSQLARRFGDRKSTRLNSSHGSISYAVFCLKKKKTE